jgi:MFS family permease
VEGNSLLYQSRALAAVAGPSVGGLLVEALTAPLALAADALSFLGSAFILARIRPAEPAPDQDRRRGALSAGARFIWTSAILRPSLACVSVINFFSFMFMALFVLYATRSLHVRPGELGVVLGAGAVGGVLGALLTRRIAARAGVGRAYLIGCIVYPAPILLVPLAGGPRPLILGMLVTAEFVSGFGVMILDISIGTIVAAVVPDPLRSRVSGAFQAINYGTRPVGSLVGGAAGTLLGLHPALWIAAAGGTLGFLCLLPSPMPRFRLEER